MQPEVMEGWGLAGEVTATALDQAFAAAVAEGNPATAALVVSPTYFGQVSNVAGEPSCWFMACLRISFMLQHTCPAPTARDKSLMVWT